MPEIISAELRREMKLWGIEVVKDGAQPIPAKDLGVSLSESKLAGALLYHAPRYTEGTSGGKLERVQLGEGLYAVFDTIVEHDGVQGLLCWRFNDVVHGQGSVVVENTELSTGIGVWTIERMREATEVK